MQIVRVLWISRSVGFSLLAFSRDVILRCVLAVIVALIIPIILHLLLPNGVFTVLVVCVVSVVCMALCSLFIGFNHSERTTVLNMLIKKLNINSK